jgi:hypothetical protein
MIWPPSCARTSGTIRVQNPLAGPPAKVSGCSGLNDPVIGASSQLDSHRETAGRPCRGATYAISAGSASGLAKSSTRRRAMSRSSFCWNAELISLSAPSRSRYQG